MKKSYNEKLHSPADLPKIESLLDHPEIQRKLKADTMLIASPEQYNEIMARVPKGKLVTSATIRGYLARQAGADTTCPLTAGIFINICAHAALERDDDGFPWWRTTKTDGQLNEKYPDGIEFQKRMLESEGFVIISKGKSYYVDRIDEFIWEIE